MLTGKIKAFYEKRKAFIHQEEGFLWASLALSIFLFFSILKILKQVLFLFPISTVRQLWIQYMIKIGIQRFHNEVLISVKSFYSNLFEYSKSVNRSDRGGGSGGPSMY